MMEIFALAIYTCSVMGGGTDTVTTTCQWRQTGAFYRDSSDCETEGQSRVGKEYFTDFYPNPKVERSRCDPLHVR